MKKMNGTDKTKKAVCYIDKKKHMVLCFLKKSKIQFQIHSEKRKEKKNVMYAFKWYFMAFCTIQPLVKIYI